MIHSHSQCGTKPQRKVHEGCCSSALLMCLRLGVKTRSSRRTGCEQRSKTSLSLRCWPWCSGANIQKGYSKLHSFIKMILNYKMTVRMVLQVNHLQGLITNPPVPAAHWREGSQLFGWVLKLLSILCPSPNIYILALSSACYIMPLLRWPVIWKPTKTSHYPQKHTLSLLLIG